MIKNNMTKKKAIYNFLILLPYFWLVTGLFVYKDSDKGMVIMMIISVIASLFSQGSKVIKENIVNSKMLWVIFATTLYALFSYFYHGLSSREIRAFIALFIFLPFFPRALLTKNLLIILTIIGSFVSFISAFYYSTIIELQRAWWPINAIPFATIVATFSLLAINFLVTTDSKVNKALLLLSLLLSIAALGLSQTRGVWIAFAISMGTSIILIIKSRKVKYDYKVILGGLILLLITVAISYQKIEQRLAFTQYELNNMGSGQLTNSIGLRLEMLKVTPDMVKGDLLLGTGNNHLDKLDKLYAQGKTSKALHDYVPPHYHNQYADKIIKNGLIGLVLFILLLTIPLKESQHASVMNRHIIIGIVLLFSISAITDAPFNHGQSLFVFVLLLYGLTQKNSTIKVKRPLSNHK